MLLGTGWSKVEHHKTDPPREAGRVVLTSSKTICGRGLLRSQQILGRMFAPVLFFCFVFSVELCSAF